ncbi:MAG: RIP metalloprotease RseP [Chlamydiae bacterium]|nr:RIP metalloprotease RseP [Chlamydiota bacterium]MBI3265768.1 RIP metalloprotease RseP [Chlamydiota bacterium]
MEGLIGKIFFNGFIPLFALGVVVFVHELGHFLVARGCGIRVLKFSIGFGPKIYSWKRGETEYCISWLFFGGFVKFVGDELEGQSQEVPEGGFYAVSPGRRILTCLAGPAMNLLFGFLIYCVIFVIGKPTVVDEKSNMIGSILEKSPSQDAGLQLGDRILEVDGKAVSSWKDIINATALSYHESVLLKILRDGQEIKIAVSPRMDQEKGLRLIGISAAESILVGEVQKQGSGEKAGLQKGDMIIGFRGEPVYQWDVLMKKLEENRDQETSLEVERSSRHVTLHVKPLWNSGQKKFMIGFTRDFKFEEEHPNPFLAMAHDIASIFETLRALFARTVSPKGLAGPLGIVMMIGAFAKVGFSYLLALMALISVNLGIFNLLPIPVLDGGHVLFNGIEMIFRRALPKKAMVLIQNVFVAAFIFLALFVTYHDLMRWGSDFFGK